MIKDWKLIGAYLIGGNALITIQHKGTKDVLQLFGKSYKFRHLIENGFDEAIIEIVLLNYNLIK